MKKSSIIELYECLPGQKLKNRDGTIYTYNGPHPNGGYLASTSDVECRFTTDGKDWFRMKGWNDHTWNDIVEVLPFIATVHINGYEYKIDLPRAYDADAVTLNKI